jgi:hypothetical protein
MDSATTKKQFVIANTPKQEQFKYLKDVDSYEQYIGYAGELRVMSELMIRGVNAINGRIDNGYDISAFKGDKIFSIQVKTGFITKEKRYSFNVPDDEVSSIVPARAEIFYVFVMISDMGERMDCLVLPKKEFAKQRKAGNIWHTESTHRYKIKIYLRDNKAYFGKVSNDLTKHLNNWNYFIN